jgi:Cu+-exporting ATPase
VLVVACSCSFALATPIAVLASIGAAARRGLMIKGGAVLESLARADVLLIDKTGTLTLGKAQIQQVVALHPEWIDERQLLRLAASLERYSEHPLAAAVRQKAAQVGIPLEQVDSFEATPGRGVSAIVDGRGVIAGNQPMMEDRGVSMNDLSASMGELTGQGATLLLVAVDRRLAGVLVATDTLRPEVPQAMEEIRSLGIRTIELLSGDRQASVQALVQSLGGETILGSRAELLPEDKIAVVKEYQARGHVVVMVGDGVNDAPALAQADVGIAMGAAGSDVAIQAAHAALMREDWLLVPQLLRIARRTMYTVRGNLAFTIAYNLIGLSLAALGFLPPVLAAAAQSVPDLGILANSSRLIRQKP